MSKIASVIALSAILLSSTTIAAPVADMPVRRSGPSIVANFFTDVDCSVSIPNTVYNRTIFGDTACNVYTTASQAFSSFKILSIDDQFIGTNTALQIGHTNGDTCDDFTASVKYDISNRESVGKCQSIGISQGLPQSEHAADLTGNECRLTVLEDSVGLASRQLEAFDCILDGTCDCIAACNCDGTC